MEKKTFDIANIKSQEDLNALSIALNEKEQVSHMKIGKNNITFKCIDIDVLKTTILTIDETLIVKEIVGGEKKIYDFGKARDRKYYFMFKNLVNEDDILTLVKQIEEHEKYKDVLYDNANRVLMFTTDEKEVNSKIKKRMKNINPSIEVYEHRMPVRSQDVFQKKFIVSYLKIGFLLVTIALAIVTSKDETPMTSLFWMLSILLIGDRITKSAWKNIRLMNFLHEDILVCLAILLGIAGGYPLGSLITMVLYMFFEPFRIKVLRKSFEKIDEAIEKPEKGMRDLDDHTEIIPLHEFEEGDVIVVPANEMIPIPGVIIEGRSELNIYPNTGSYEYISVKEGDSVHSGDVNLSETLKIRVTDTYESGNLAHILEIASVAPIYQSEAEKYIKKFSDYYTPVIVVLAIIVGVILPIIDIEEYGRYIHLGAILLLISGSFAYEQSASLGMLAGFARAFQQGIIVESSRGLDAVNEAQVIVYDTIDNKEMSVEEFELLNKLSHLGRVLIVFNDSTKNFEDDQYKIYNHLSTQEKLDIIENAIGSVVYIGDSSKDIECFQNSDVAISRGGIKDSKVVENSDIVLVDSAFDRVYETFAIARKMRTTSIINLIISIIMKLIIIIAAFTLMNLPLWLTLVYEAIVVVIVMHNATHIIE
ncbi:MAG: hypothetical protein U0L85_06535 [Bacilli bacterium]|nr:hypothetical protein [Bacilli bacterium]